LNMKENEQKSTADAFDCQNSLRKEVGLPQTGSMAFEKFIPRRAGSLGAGFEAAFLQNVADRTLADRANPQLPEFTHDSGVAPGVFLGEFDDQLSDLFGRASSTSPCSRQYFSAGSFLFANPAQKGSGCDDGHDLVNGFAKLDTELQ